MMKKKRLNKATFTVNIGMILLCDHFIEKIYQHSESDITSYLPVHHWAMEDKR